MQTITLDPMSIKVKDGLERFRRDLGKVKDLAESIAKYGQLQPVVITRDHELICGGRRLAACIMSQQQIICAYQDTVDPLMMREMELEENLQRKEFSPAEECLAVEEIHKLKTQINGEAVSGKKGGWKLDDTAEAIGKTRGNVIESLQIAEMVRLFPELKNAKTKSEIKKVAKGLEKIAAVTDAITKMEELAKTEQRFKVFNMDARDFLTMQPAGKFNIIITDPPYGINVCDTKGTSDGRTGGNDVTGIRFNDRPDVFLDILGYLPRELYRITTHDAQGFMFFAPEFYQPAIEAFRAAGWNPYIRPIVWTKQHYGHTNCPSMYPTSSYEMALFFRKLPARLIKEGLPDYISAPPCLNKDHTTEKPEEVINNLLSRIALPGMKMADPFMGSGAILSAAVKAKLFVEGCDLLEECYALALNRLGGIK